MKNATLERPASTPTMDPTSTSPLRPSPPPTQSGSGRLKPKPARQKQKVQVRSKLISYPQTVRHARAHRVELAVFRVLMFLFITVTAYAVSSIAGQVAVEKSRREELSARDRAKSLAMTEAALRSEIVALTRPDRIDQWAAANSFVNPNGPTLTQAPKHDSQLLALRD